MLRTLCASSLRHALPGASSCSAAAPVIAAAQPAAVSSVCARSFSHAAPRSAAAAADNSSSSSSSASSSTPRKSLLSEHRPRKQAPRPELPFPARVPLAVPAGVPGMDSQGHWHESAPKHPSFKESIAAEVYTNAEVRGSGYIKPKHANSPVAIHGIGVPSVRQSMPAPPRRTLRPHSVQDVPHPMKTYTTGPREMGHKIVRTFIGHVTSDKMQKTVAVEVSQFYRHPKYHKYIKTSKKFLAHDENEECNIGDVVEIRVCRPLSKRKHFTLHRVIKPKLELADAAKLFVAALPDWKQNAEHVDFKSFDQLEAEQAAEEAAYTAREKEIADEEAMEAMEAAEQRPSKA